MAFIRDIPTGGEDVWVRDSNMVREKWQEAFKKFSEKKNLKPEHPNSIPAEIQFFEIPQELYDILPQLSDSALSEIRALLQHIESLPYAQKDFYESQRKIKNIPLSDKLPEQQREHYESQLHEEMVNLCRGALHLEEAMAGLKSFIDQLLKEAGKKALYNEADPYERKEIQPIWDRESSSYNMLPKFAQQAVDRLTEMYKTGDPLSMEVWDSYLNNSNKVNYININDPKERLSALVVALNDFGAFKYGKVDRRLPILPE